MLDVDGVVADVRHRLHHLASRPKNWDAFFAGAAADPPLARGVELASRLSADHDVVWLTGRPERLRQVTGDWLLHQELPAGPLHMRANGDFRPAREIKLAVLFSLAATRSIAIMVDDDPAVVTWVGAAGVPTQLADWVPYDGGLRTAQERDGRT